MVEAGLIPENTSPCASPIALLSAASVMNIRVRTTSSARAPASPRAASMICRQRRAWAPGSGSTEPSGQMGAVPATMTWSPIRTARQNPIVPS